MALKSSKTLLATAVSAGCLTVCNSVNAQSVAAQSVAAQQAPILEEVLVTATKREQSLQEIPLSVAAVTGEKLDETGTKTLADLTTLVPNIHFTQTGVSTQMRIRGIGSDNSQGFEQSVGVYVDGIFRGRAQMFRAPMFDMERVEVLRGPQSTLFGKNSIAGALDLITAKPTEELTGSFTAIYEAEFGTTEVTSVVSGPLTETFRGRIALRQLDDPGYMENAFKNNDEPEIDALSGRLSLEWEPNAELIINYTGERNKFDALGRPIEITKAEPSLSQIPGLAGATYQQILVGAFGQPTFDVAQDYVRATDANEFSDNTMTSHTLKAEWDVNGYTMTSLSGHIKYDYDENCDCDFVPAEVLNLQLKEDYSQFSQEIRFASPLGNTIDWLGGVFIQGYRQNFFDQLSVARGSLLPRVVEQSIPRSVYLATFDAAKSQGANDAQADAAAQAQSAAITPLAPAFGNAFADTGVSRDFYQRSLMQSIFGQMTWNTRDDLRFIVGGRYTHETKRASKYLTTLDLTTGEAWVANPVDDPVFFIPQTDFSVFTPAGIYAGPSFRTDTGDRHDIKDSRSESAFTPLLIAQWDINEDSSTYLSWTKGFKAGGFDPRSNREAAFEFEEEKAEAIELGYKTSFWNNRGEVNLALYHTNYEDLQVSQFDGAVGFNVGNAKETRVQGLEVDGRVALTNNLLATYGLSLLDFEYKDYKNGNCYFGQSGVDNNGDGINECDYTGEEAVYTPDYTVNFSLDYRRDVGKTLEFAAILDGQVVDGHQVHVNLDPEGKIDSYSLVGLRLQIGGEHWHTALLGKNLLDENIITYSANAPLSENSFAANTYYSFINRPRTVALEAAFKF